jgi:uncharacterized protein
MKKFILCLTLLFLLILPSTLAVITQKESKINLLSVAITDDETYVGKTAELSLYIREGRGSVFIESYPLSKIDTQLSAQLANKIACSLSKIDCNKYDFFYTLRVDSSIVGGPSAGGAFTLLTLSMLEDLPLKEKFAMTGMITSGGIITPVDGIPEKVEAAANAKYDFVLIPELSLNTEFFIDVKNNLTNNLTLAYLSKYNITIYPINTIWEALELTSDYQKKEITEVQVPKFYTLKMKEISQRMCNRTNDILKTIPENKKNTTLYFYANNFYNKSINSSSEEKYYSTASYCYSGSLKLRELQLENVSQKILLQNYNNLFESLIEFDTKINNYSLKTFTDLETYMIVKERLIETRDALYDINKTNISHSKLAYAIERFNSAVIWSSFLGEDGVDLVINEDNLRVACYSEVQYVDMVLNYLLLYLPPEYVEDLTKSLDHSKEFMGKQDYKMCFYTASKAKSNANFILNSLTLSDDNKTRDLTRLKLERAKELISEQRNSFPIMGYSYLEYSNSLIEDDLYASLLFSEFSLSFSDISNYFPEEKIFEINIGLKLILMCFLIFISGIFCGFIFFAFLFRKNKRKKLK